MSSDAQAVFERLWKHVDYPIGGTVIGPNGGIWFDLTIGDQMFRLIESPSCSFSYTCKWVSMIPSDAQLVEFFLKLE